MGRDPIVDEVRAIREALAEECGYDVREIVRILKKEESESGQPVVSLPPRKMGEQDEPMRPDQRSD
ncbi:MAG TPA: hypothetical protein VH877_26220 [Polyangia bacterium]|jgi:hypothetical protein|nr:hypothetical protein [Polyangia bacterium]